MAKIVNDNDEKDVVVSEVTTEKPVPANVVTLSSGVRVQFLGKLPPTTAQQVVVSTFQNSNLDAQGNLKDNMSPIEQLRLAKKMFDYNKAIVSFALSMQLIKLYDGLPADKSWLDYLEVNPIVKADNPNIDFTKKIHQELLYLMYVAFADEKDLEHIGARLLNN